MSKVVHFLRRLAGPKIQGVGRNPVAKRNSQAKTRRPCLPFSSYAKVCMQARQAKAGMRRREGGSASRERFCRGDFAGRGRPIREAGISSCEADSGVNPRMAATAVMPSPQQERHHNPGARRSRRSIPHASGCHRLPRQKWHGSGTDPVLRRRSAPHKICRIRRSGDR